MRAEIYRRLKAIGFIEAEARKMSAEFVYLLKSLGIVCTKAVKSIGQALIVSLLQTWLLGLI